MCKLILWTFLFLLATSRLNSLMTLSVFLGLNNDILHLNMGKEESQHILCMGKV